MTANGQTDTGMEDAMEQMMTMGMDMDEMMIAMNVGEKQHG